ncbi:MAG: T9SS C-terminal target domain-containing protein [Flavobacterium sp.]
MKIHIFFFCLIYNLSNGQNCGCTDLLAKNYNANATVNDGSCSYKKTKIKPEFSNKISDSIKETSGLIAFDSLLWTHNDDHDTTLYGMDTLGEIRKKTVLNHVKNQDWEEMSQDQKYIYIGDFGNNYRGNRRDLQILKINKNSLNSQKQVIDTLAYSYEDQTDFNTQKSNSTNFDCEAFIVLPDSIYLFTKEWKNKKTTIYSIPNTTGTHVAQKKTTLNTHGLITGATYLPSQKIIALCGYSKKAKPFIFLLYDFKNTDFLSGNKRKIQLKLPFHQVEGIATTDGIHYYLTNEKLKRKPILNVSQKLHKVNLSSLLSHYLQKKHQTNP